MKESEDQKSLPLNREKALAHLLTLRKRNPAWFQNFSTLLALTWLLWSRLEYILLSFVSFYALANYPWQALFVLPPAWIGLTHRKRLSLPTGRLLAALLAGSTIAAYVTLQIAPQRPLAAFWLMPVITINLAALGFMALYFTLPALRPRQAFPGQAIG